MPGPTPKQKPSSQAALAVLEQMFAYFTFDRLPLEKPLYRRA